MEPEGQQNNGPTDVSSVNEGANLTVDDSTPLNPTSVENSQPAATAPMGGKSKDRKKVGLIAGVTVAVLALAGSASAYQFWYQNPDKVMADAVSHLMTTKQARITGDIVVASEDVDLTVALKMNGDEKDSSVTADVTITPKTEETKFLGDIKLGADAVMASNGDVYFKMREVRPVIDKLIDTSIQMQVDMYETEGYEISKSELDSQRAEVAKSIDPVVDKIDNKWIKVTADDLRQDGEDVQACILDAVEKNNNDDAMRNQLIDTYKKNKFVRVDKELGVKDGNVGYELKIDDAAAEAFSKDIENTTFGSELKKCDETIFKDINEDVTPAIDDNVQVTTEVWITRWSHQLSAFKVAIEDKDDKMSAKLDFGFVMNQSDEVVIPTDATSITELQDDIMELMSGAVGAESLSA
jgi:hypothetical protein